MIVYESDSKYYAKQEKAIAAHPDIEPVEVTIPDGIARRELGTGELVDIPQAELDTIAAEQAVSDEEFAATAWLRGRQAGYLSTEDQLDMIYWDMVNGTTTFVDHRSGVKAAHPKPV